MKYCPYCNDEIRQILIGMGRTVEIGDKLFCSDTCAQLYKEVRREPNDKQLEANRGSPDVPSQQAHDKG